MFLPFWSILSFLSQSSNILSMVFSCRCVWDMHLLLHLVRLHTPGHMCALQNQKSFIANCALQTRNLSWWQKLPVHRQDDNDKTYNRNKQVITTHNRWYIMYIWLCYLANYARDIEDVLSWYNKNNDYKWIVGIAHILLHGGGNI